MPTFEAMAVGYRNMWQSMRITRAAACEAAARKIMAARAHYVEIEQATGVPWFWIGCAHMRESNNNFAGVLHNGEHIVGTGRKTRLVPAGRGPFRSWEEAAIDAIKLKGLHNIRNWDVARMGYEFERFNGFGYVARGVNSPYVWAGSQHYTRGKYVADGVFSAGHVDTQLGCMPVLKALCNISAEVDKRVNGPPANQWQAPTAVGGGGSVIATGVQQGWGWTEWGIAAVVAAAVIAGVVYLVHRWRTREPANLPPVIDQPDAVSVRAGAAEEATS